MSETMVNTRRWPSNLGYHLMLVASSHHQQLPGLNRAIGQLEAIKRMIEEKKYCIDIITQLRAARNALKAVELKVLSTHMANCVNDSFASQNKQHQRQLIDEIMELLKKYQ